MHRGYKLSLSPAVHEHLSFGEELVRGAQWQIDTKNSEHVPRQRQCIWVRGSSTEAPEPSKCHRHIKTDESILRDK